MAVLIVLTQSPCLVFLSGFRSYIITKSFHPILAILVPLSAKRGASGLVLKPLPSARIYTVSFYTASPPNAPTIVTLQLYPTFISIAYTRNRGAWYRNCAAAWDTAVARGCGNKCSFLQWGSFISLGRMIISPNNTLFRNCSVNFLITYVCQFCAIQSYIIKFSA